MKARTWSGRAAPARAPARVAPSTPADEREKKAGLRNRGLPFERELETMHASWRGQVIGGAGGPRVVGGRGVIIVKVPTDVAVRRDEDGGLVGASFRTAKRVVDFLGALEDGDAVAIEAKTHGGTRFPLREVTDWQRDFMRGWRGLGLLLVRMTEGGMFSTWATPFAVFLREYDAGVKSWPLPGHEGKVARLRGERTMADVCVRLAFGSDWHRALRQGRLDDLLNAGEGEGSR